MIKGLEFLKSWRYWAWMVGATGLMTLGMVGVHFLNATYFGRMLDGSPDPAYPVLLGFLLFALSAIVPWRVVKRDEVSDSEQYEYGGRVQFTVLISAIGLSFVEFYLAKRVLSAPVLESIDNTLPLPFFVVLVGVMVGFPVAMLEWTRMTGADRSVSAAKEGSA